MAARSSGIKRGLIGLLGAILVALGLAWAVPLPARLGSAHSPALLDAEGDELHVALAPDDRWRLPTDLRRVDPAYLSALLAVEDARFYAHPGVDPAAVLRAARSNLQAGHVVSGASTLTMQLVRLMEPRPRTMLSKGIEALRAVQLELRMSKQEILLAYLTFLPFGGNLEGVETACWALFGHPASELSDAEIALLIAIPQDPNGRRLGPVRRARLQAARDAVGARLAEAGLLRAPGDPGGALEDLRRAPLPSAHRALPRGLPHLAADALRGGGRVPTTIDRGLQARAERLVAETAGIARQNNVHNVSIVVMEHETGAVRALVGGFDFSLDTPSGQVPSWRARRSPGSTLKPLLYAMALTDGLILPETLVTDVPVRFGSYEPRNFNDRYQGVVRMEEALSRSLNVPFVQLLQRVGLEAFLEKLRAAGVEGLERTPGHYGLSAAVGGLALSPLELAGVYGALARGGAPVRAHLSPRGDTAGAAPLVAPGAAFLTRRALRLRDRPDFPSRRELSGAPEGVAWKTGTSFGHRDAWAVGIGPRFVVVVWLGNLDHRASRWLLGAEAAGPLLFDLLDGLGERATAAELPPEDLGPVSICPLSGHVPGPACPSQEPALALRDRVPPERCPMHQRVEIDVKTGEEVGPDCRAGRETFERVVVVQPESADRWLRSQGRGGPPGPPLAPGCAPARRSPPPRVVGPAPGTVILLIPGMLAAEQEVALESEGGAAPLQWFVDGRLIDVAGPDGRAWWAPTLGQHELLVVDAAGRSAARSLEVRLGTGAGAPD
jgi:penicillin-binding protein 1C